MGTVGPRGPAATVRLASGAMLYVVLGELLPESTMLWKNKTPGLTVVVGMLITKA